MDYKQTKKLFDLASYACFHQAPQKALEYCNEIIETSKSPTYIRRAKNIKIFSYYDLGKYDDAIKLAKKNLETYNRSDCTNSLKILGECYYEKQEYQTALKYCLETLEEYEKEDWIEEKELQKTLYISEYILAAKCLINFNQYKLAIEYAKQARKLYPTFEDTKKLLQKTKIILDKIFELKCANLDEKNDILIDDDQVLNVYLLAGDLSILQCFDEAINVYDKIIETSKNPKYIKSSREQKVSSYYFWGKYDEAIKTANETLEIYDRSICETVLEFLGKSYYAKKEYQTALEYFSETLKVCESRSWMEENEDIAEMYFEDLYKDLAECHFNLQQYALAVKYMKEAVALNPTYAENKKLLEQMEAKLNEAPDVKRTNYGRKVDF